MRLMSLVLITLVAGFVLASAESTGSEAKDPVESVVNKKDETKAKVDALKLARALKDLKDLPSTSVDKNNRTTKAEADDLLQAFKIEAGMFGYTLLRGLIIDTKGLAVSSTDKDFALKLTPQERNMIARAFRSGSFDSFTKNGVAAEGVTYQMSVEPKDGIASATADDQTLYMSEVPFGIAVLLLVTNE